MVGDSIVEGHGVQTSDTFSSHLQKELEGSGWQIINLGVQGASPIYFAANLERYIYLNPEAVLLLINENDLHEDEVREKSYFYLPVLENRKTLYSGNSLHSLADKSRLLGFLKENIRAFFKTPLEQIISANAKISKKHVDQKSSHKGSSFLIPPSRIDQRWDMSRKYLSYFLDRLREKDIKVMVSTLCSVTLASPNVRAYTEYCSNLETRVEEWASYNALPYLSMVPTMRRTLHRNRRNDVLIFNDLHPTPLTHQILADVLYQLRNKRLVLIDTAGMGQRDVRLSEQLATLVNTSHVNIRSYLVLPATAQRKVLQEAIEQFRKIPIAGCIMTKMDEALGTSEVLSVAIGHSLPIGYVTYGQRVPEDIGIVDINMLVNGVIEQLGGDDADIRDFTSAPAQFVSFNR